MPTPTDHLLDLLMVPAPAESDARVAWIGQVVQRVLDTDPLALHPTPASLMARLDSPVSGPAYLPVWVIVWGLGYWVADPVWVGTIGRVLTAWWPRISSPALGWPPLWPTPSQMARTVGWSNLAEASQAAWPLPRLAASPRIAQEEAWTTAQVDRWPELAASVFHTRPRFRSLRQRRLICRAWQAQRSDVALALGAGNWLEGNMPLTVPRQAPLSGDGLVSLVPLLDALSEHDQLRQPHHLEQVLDQVLQPALLAHRPEIWAGTAGTPSTPGIRLWQRAVLAAQITPINSPLPGAGPAWWQALMGHRTHLWHHGWAVAGTTPAARWAALLQASHHRSAWSAWAVVALGGRARGVFGSACPWAELPPATVAAFFEASVSPWVALAAQQQALPPLTRWAALGLWRTARAHPRYRVALLPALLGHLAVLDTHPRGGEHRWVPAWTRLRAWAQADPDAFLAADLPLAFLDHAPTQSRWRQLRLTLRPAGAVRPRNRV